jgi:uncharacterized membrane protein
MKTTILGGILFLAPLAVLAILLGKVFQLSLMVVKPVESLIPVERFIGVATINLLAIALIVLVCYLAGIIAERAITSRYIQRLDEVLMDLIPPYAVFKAVVGSMSSREDLSSEMNPVLVQFDDYDQVAFELERDGQRSVLFLPGTPSAWSGSTVVADTERVQYLHLPTHQALKLMRTFGRGTLAARIALDTGAEATSEPKSS